MRKTFFILLIASIALIYSSEAFAGCAGACTGCATYTGQSACAAQSGCTWTAAACAGTANACSSYTTSSACTACGCTWNSGLSRCQGTSSCSSYSAQGTCSTCGCLWSAQSCSGSCSQCTTLATQTSCESQDGCSWSVACGDNVCDSAEDCSCSDCEGEQAGCQSNYFCSGGACTYSGTGGACADAGGTCYAGNCGSYINCREETGGSCTTGYCCTGECNVEFSECGNERCQSGETCLNCPADCGTCVEDALTLAFRDPIGGDTLKRGPYKLKVVVFKGTTTEENAQVTAESPLFERPLALYNDRTHGDEKAGDGVYTIEFETDKSTAPGQYEIRVTARRDASTAEGSIKITIDPDYKIIMPSLAKGYVQGERIVLDGSVKNFKGAVPNVTVNIYIDYLGQMLYKEEIVTGSSGNFESSYPVSFADPKGKWHIKAVAEDDYGNRGALELEPEIGIPAGVLYYLINFLSPVKGSEFSRGNNVPVTAEVTEEGIAVAGANVSFSSPSGKLIALSETGEGIYTGEYNIQINDNEGPWRLAVQAVKKEGNAIKAGGNSIPLNINPAAISIEFLLPEKQGAFTGAEVEYRVMASYQGGKPVRGANLTLNVKGKTEIKMQEIEEGIYVADYHLAPEEIGTLSATVIAMDEDGNKGEAKANDIFVRKRTIPELYMLVAYQEVIRPYWWALLSAALVLGAAVAPHFRKKMLMGKIAKAGKEMETVKSMQIEAEQAYYSKGTISKDDFRKLVQQYKERAAKAMEQQRNAQKKLEKK